MKVINTSQGGIPTLSPEVNAWVTAVLTQDDAGLYAVYVGVTPVSWNFDRTKEIVAHRGRKLSWEKAKFFFPDLDEKEYRK